jgi:hypothetical protein
MTVSGWQQHTPGKSKIRKKTQRKKNQARTNTCGAPVAKAQAERKNPI